MTASFPDLAGRAVFITGGGSGIGAGLTRGFAAQGARVAFVQRSDATSLVEQIETDTGSRPLAVRSDISDPVALRRAIEIAREALGPISVLVCNAADDTRMNSQNIEPEDWRRAMAINLDHYFFAAQSVLPDMRAARDGRIVMLSSISYMMGMGGLLPYTTANAGITAMVRSLARDFGPDGIRVNALAPGMVLTERQERLWLDEEVKSKHMETQCLKRHLTPEDMIGPALFLASDISAAITGQCLAADAGVAFPG